MKIWTFKNPLQILRNEKTYTTYLPKVRLFGTLEIESLACPQLTILTIKKQLLALYLVVEIIGIVVVVVVVVVATVVAAIISIAAV